MANSQLWLQTLRTGVIWLGPNPSPRFTSAPGTRCIQSVGNSSPPVSETDLRCHETGVQCRDGVCTEVGPELVPRARVTV